MVRRCGLIEHQARLAGQVLEGLACDFLKPRCYELAEQLTRRGVRQYYNDIPLQEEIPTHPSLLLRQLATVEIDM